MTTDIHNSIDRFKEITTKATTLSSYNHWFQSMVGGTKDPGVGGTKDPGVDPETGGRGIKDPGIANSGTKRPTKSNKHRKSTGTDPTEPHSHPHLDKHCIDCGLNSEGKILCI